jgi:hypothetical protein
MDCKAPVENLDAEKESVMRRVLMMMAAGVFVLGTAGTAQAQVIRMHAHLNGANETPAPGVLTGSYGFAEVLIDLATRVVSWHIDVWNMPSGTNNAHFHVGGPGLAGPTVINIPFPANVSNDYELVGSATALSAARADQGIRTMEDFIQSAVGGQIYINIHSVNFPGGEIRGNLTMEIDPEGTTTGHAVRTPGGR